MKKNLLFYLILIIFPIITIIFMSFSGGIPTQVQGGVTGSPGDEAAALTIIGLTSGSCSSCHDNNGHFNASVSISTNIPANGYELGKTYQVTVTPFSVGANEHGFEITAENAAESKVGVFSITDAINTMADTFGYFVSHTLAGSEGVTSWSFNWTAPSTDKGTIIFYAAAVAGNKDSNGNATTTNTQVAFATLNVGGVLGINEARLLNFSMFPNPSDGKVILQLPSGTNQAKVNMYDYLGKSLIKKTISSSDNTIDISNLSSGIYFIRVETDTKIGTKKLVIR